MKKVKQIHKLNSQTKATPDQIWRFLEDYASLVQGRDEKTVAISIRVPKNILSAFKTRANLDGIKYQSQIVKLMRQWLIDSK
jgi:predicted DNA binding CopG/RHH family protein